MQHPGPQEWLAEHSHLPRRQVRGRHRGRRWPHGGDLVHDDYSGRVWDLTTVKELALRRRAEDGGCRRFLARLQTARVVGHEWRRPSLQSRRRQATVPFSPQGDTVATGSEDGSLVFWDTATGKERGRVSIAALGPAGYVSSTISAIAFAPDGKTLAAAPQDQTVRLLDVATK